MSHLGLQRPRVKGAYSEVREQNQAPPPNGSGAVYVRFPASRGLAPPPSRGQRPPGQRAPSRWGGVWSRPPREATPLHARRIRGHRGRRQPLGRSGGGWQERGRLETQASETAERSPKMGRRASPPSSSRRCESSWRAALLAAFILNSCFLLTQSQVVKGATKIPVKWEPSHPIKGQSLTLTPGGSLNFLFCYWHRGDQVDESNRIFMYLPSPEQLNGVGHTGRETGGPNCSLHIKRLTSEDTGNYTVWKAVNGSASEIGRAYVTVLGSRALDKGTIAGIVIGALCLAVLIGFILYWICCGWCCYCSCQCETPSGRYPPHPHDLGPRRHMV